MNDLFICTGCGFISTYRSEFMRINEKLFCRDCGQKEAYHAKKCAECVHANQKQLTAQASTEWTEQNEIMRNMPS